MQDVPNGSMITGGRMTCGCSPQCDNPVAVVVSTTTPEGKLIDRLPLCLYCAKECIGVNWSLRPEYGELHPN